MRIVLAGTGRLGVSLLDPLSKSPHEVVAVIQDGRKVRGFRRFYGPRLARIFASSQSMMGRARKFGIPIIWINKMTEKELAPLRRLAPDLLVVGGFGIIFKKPLLELPKIGCVNTHSSLLPRHRGPNPFHAAIIAGDPESGVTFHVMEEGIDSGPILSQVRFPLGPSDTVFTVYVRACDLAGEHIVGVVDRIEHEGLKGVPQPTEGANYARKPAIDDTWLDWNETAQALDRQVRALSPSPMPRFKFRGRCIRVARTEYNPEPVDAAPGTVLKNRGGIRVATGLGTLTLRVAYAMRPLPWVWPSRLSRPAVGERLE